MSVYFAFSDECGSFKASPSEKFLKAHPFYIRATFLMNANEWTKLNKRFNDVKRNELKKYLNENDLYKEIKWSFLWSLKKNSNISKTEEYYFLRKVPYQVLFNFVRLALNLFNELEYLKIITTITLNSSAMDQREIDIYKWHLQDIMERIEMEIQNDDDNLCILFIDSVSQETDKLLRDAYFDIYNNGDFIKNYSHIKDSISIEFSHQSVGVQLADYIAGSINGALKKYPGSTNLYHNMIKPFLRRNNTGKLIGYGIKETPRDQKVRSFLKSILSEGHI